MVGLLLLLLLLGGGETYPMVHNKSDRSCSGCPHPLVPIGGIVSGWRRDKIFGPGLSIADRLLDEEA